MCVKRGWWFVLQKVNLLITSCNTWKKKGWIWFSKIEWVVDIKNGGVFGIENNHLDIYKMKLFIFSRKMYTK